MYQTDQDMRLHENRALKLGEELKKQVDESGSFETLEELLDWSSDVLSVSPSRIRNSLKACGYWVYASQYLTRSWRAESIQNELIAAFEKSLEK